MDTECSPHRFYEPSVYMTNSKCIPSTSIDWYGASNLLLGLVRADLRPEWIWGANEGEIK